MSTEEKPEEELVQEALAAVDFLIEQSRARFPEDLPLLHPERLSAWRNGTGGSFLTATKTKEPDNPLAQTLESHRAYAEALLLQEQLHKTSFDINRREELIQRALGILPASAAARFLEIHPCTVLLPRNIADSTEKLLKALELGTSLIGEAYAFAYIMLIVAGLRALTEFEQYGSKLDNIFEQVFAAPAVTEVLSLSNLTESGAGFEPQFRLLIGVRERLFALKRSRLAPTGFLLTSVIDAYLSDRPSAGNALGLAVFDTVLITRLGFPVRYIYKEGVILIEVLITNRSVYWDPTKPVPLSFEPMFTGQSLTTTDLIGLTYASLASYHFSRAEWDKAIAHYLRVLEFIPDSPETYANLALCYIRKNEPDRAIKVLEEAMVYAPNYASLPYLLGIAHSQTYRWRQAVAAYKRALTINPDFPEALFNLGIALEKMGSFEQAVAALKKAVEIKPDYIPAFLALGNIHLEERRFKEAITWYQEALKYDPRLVSAHYNLGRAYYELRDLDSAIHSYQEAIKINPKHAGAWHNLGIAYRDKGLKEKAVEALEQAIALNPTLMR
ncbi:MAG: tetratricopeptide repeat protein [candidate division WOR-3 bacterium]